MFYIATHKNNHTTSRIASRNYIKKRFDFLIKKSASGYKIRMSAKIKFRASEKQKCHLKLSKEN